METSAAKSFYPASATNLNVLSPSDGVHLNNADFSNMAHRNRSSANFSTTPQSRFLNRFFNSTSDPPRVPSFNNGCDSFCSTGSEDLYVEDRYSSFRRDFENAIDASFSSLFHPSVISKDFLPFDIVRKIEEQAFREGLARGVQQCAYKAGYEFGLQCNAGFPNGNDNGTTGSNTSNSSSSSIWEPPGGTFKYN